MSIQNHNDGNLYQRLFGQLEGMVSLQPFFVDNDIILFNDKWERVLPLMKDSCVDMIACDLPYGKTRNTWDKKPDLLTWWKEVNRVCKGAIVLTAQQPFSSELVISNQRMFRWEDIWKKTQATGHLNAQRMPMREHENILVFGNEIVFNPQLKPKPKENIRPAPTQRGESSCYGKMPAVRKRSIPRDMSYPSSVVEFANCQENQHPNQKPVDLFEYLLRTYSNEGDIVLDATCGSGTTLVAAKLTKRKAIGIDMGLDYCELAVNERLNRPMPLFQNNGLTS